MWHTGYVSKLAFTFKLAQRLLFPHRGAQRVVAGVCTLGIALGLMLQIVVRGVMDGMILEIERGMQVILPDLVVENPPPVTAELRAIPGIHKITKSQIGVASSPHGICQFSSWPEREMPAEFMVEGDAVLTTECCLISRSFAEKSGLTPGDNLVMHMADSVRSLRIGGIYRVPGRMLSPDALLHPDSSGGAAALSLHLDADANTEHIIQSILKLSPESRVHPTQSNTQAWQSIICRAKQTMGFILYFCTLLSAFACGALFWVIGLQHQKQFSVLFALGMTPGRIRGMILTMAGMIGAAGVTIGIPLAVLAISRREAIRQALSAIGIDAFPTDVLDMALPAHAPLPLYITHSLISLAFIFIAALPTLLSLPRLARQMPRS